MNAWFTPVGLYCERIEPSFWGEPLNAVSNLAFLLAGLWVFRQRHPVARLLGSLIVAVGLGSFLFHTFANTLTGLLDVLAIAVYLLTYAWLWPRYGHGQARAMQAVSLAALVCAVALASLMPRVLCPDLSLPPGSYVGAWLYLVVIAGLANQHKLQAARWLWAGAVTFVFSLAARELDMPLCQALGGTHWLWHLLNAVVLYCSAQAILVSTPPRR